MNKSGHTTKELLTALRQGIIYRDVARRSVHKPATDRLMDEAADMIEHLLNSRQDIIYRWSQSEQDWQLSGVDWNTHYAMITYLLNELVGKSVRIEWMPNKGEWPTFRVLSVDTDNHTAELQGINDEYGTHDGSTVLVPTEDIHSVAPL